MSKPQENNLQLNCESLEERQMLSTVDVFAAGVTNTETIELRIDGEVVQTWENLGGDAYGGDFVQLTYTTEATVDPGQIRIAFTNDTYDEATGVDSNVRIDKIVVDGVTVETESAGVFSTGTWKAEDGIVPGFRQDEFLHANGYFQFPASDNGGGDEGGGDETGDGSKIELYVQGDEGTEKFNLLIKGQIVETFDATTDLEVFTYTHNEPVNADDVRVEFINDQWEPDAGIDSNLTVDFITIDGEKFETEDPSVFSTGSWKAEDGIVPGNRESETLNVNGYFQFAGSNDNGGGDNGGGDNGGGNEGDGSVIEMNVVGDEGTEKFNLVIQGQIAGTFDATTTAQALTYTHSETVTADDVRIEFINDEWDPDAGIDSNLTVDFITIDGEKFETEDPSVFSTGSWKAEDGIAPGNRESETLNGNGYFQYASKDGGTTEQPGSFAFEESSYTVDEAGNSVQVRVNRVGGTDGVVSVDYATVAGTATALEDFVPVTGTLTFGDGQESMLITIPVIQDPFAEDGETFAIELSNATGGAAIETSSTTITISDDDTVDPAGLFRFERPMYMIMEGMMPMVSVKVIRDGGDNGEVTVDYYTESDGATAGEDFTSVSGTLTFADGETEKTIMIPVGDDDIVEDDERFWLYLDNPTGGASVVVSGAQLIIMDNEVGPGSGDGLSAQYFSNQDFTDLARVGVDSQVNFDWGRGGPAQAGTDTFSVRWTGQVETMYSEEYTFYTTADDGVRLWVNDQLIIDDWRTHPAEEKSGTISLEAGQKYDIRLEYFEQGGDASVKLEWSSASQAREIIPESQLYSNGDVQRNGSTYRLTPTKMTWAQAQSYAQRLGGNLVTVNDAAEEDFLQATFGSDEFWIGLNDVASEGNFVWASGEAVTYTNFAPNEPNNSGGNQDYGLMNFSSRKEWDDGSANKQIFGIIEVTGDSLPSQNSVFGDWGEVISMPNIAVAAAQLPDGEIVTWSSWDRFDFRGNNPRTYTSVFNTETQSVEEFLITNTQHDMFCPGTVMLPDGRIMVNGGGSTVKSVSVYDFKTDTWSRVDDMQMRRWYNTTATLADGRVLTWGGNSKDGHSGNMEVYEEGIGWTSIANSNINIYAGSGDQTSWHPQIFQAPNGKVFVAGPGENMYWADH